MELLHKRLYNTLLHNAIKLNRNFRFPWSVSFRCCCYLCVHVSFKLGWQLHSTEWCWHLLLQQKNSTDSRWDSNPCPCRWHDHCYKPATLLHHLTDCEVWHCINKMKLFWIFSAPASYTHLRPHWTLEFPYHFEYNLVCSIRRTSKATNVKIATVRGNCALEINLKKLLHKTL